MLPTGFPGSSLRHAAFSARRLHCQLDDILQAAKRGCLLASGVQASIPCVEPLSPLTPRRARLPLSADRMWENLAC